MLVEQLALAYKCHNSIGNSIDLKEMIHEVLKTFVSESYAIYSEFLIKTEDGNFEKIDSFGKNLHFDFSKYLKYNEASNLIWDEIFNFKILKLNLENGILFLVSKNSNADYSFFMSMFESLIPKLNLSVNACLNYQKLTQQKEELIKANKTKDDFLANMSHELKTPLNSITVISSIMAKNKDNKLDEAQLRNMKIIKKCSEDLLILINDILDISKIEAGLLQIHFENINLKNLLDELFDSFEEVALQKGITLKKEYLTDGFYLYSDEKRVSQIIKNFLTNAIKFTNYGSVTMKLEEFSSHYQIDVIDTGIGINENNLGHIFDRFKQVDDSTTRKYGGTGLGLTISKELASMLNLELKVESEIGKGSIFSLLIPKKFEEDEIQKTKEVKIKEIKTPKNEDDKKTVYILHSNSITQFKLSVGLKKLGLIICPVFNVEDLNIKIDSFNKNQNILFIFDKNIENFEKLVDKCNKKELEVFVLDNTNIDELKEIEDYLLVNKR